MDVLLVSYEFIAHLLIQMCALVAVLRKQLQRNGVVMVPSSL